jgi:hypothetical protein
MTVRYQTPCWIVAALLQVATPGFSEAQTGLSSDSSTTRSASSTLGATLGQIPAEAIAPGHKSATTALLWSFLGTLVPAGAGIAAASGESSDPMPGLVILGALILGPSLGHFYADRPGRAFVGIGIRTLAVAGIGAGFAATWNDSNAGGTALLFGSLALGALSVGWDVIRASHSAKVHNEKQHPGRVAIGIMPVSEARGVQIGARVAF